ncbi:MAG: GDP-mannose 4,6-dehydratase [Phycisphaeraceae bacterium]|nr:GDP-mannose 4,6-dehydratase [Phycisphaeraceae bacterium]
MNQQSDQCVLVTGAAGFIGSHVSHRLLDRGVKVVGVDNFNDFYDPAIKRANAASLAKHPGFTLMEADIRDRVAIHEVFEQKRPASVIHLAAMAGVRPSIANPSLYVEVNLNATVHLLDLAVQTGVKRFLFASSSSVYGNNDKVPFAEDDPVDHPISPYAATKKAGELLCHSYHHLYDLPIFCLRFFTVFGPGQRPDLAIAKFLGLIAEDRPIPMFGDGSTSRDYTYIDDIVDGVLAALDRCGGAELPGYRIYNLGGQDPVSLQEMIQTIGEVVGRQPRINQLQMQPGDVERTWADLNRSSAELGYQPRVSFKEGVKRQWERVQRG